MGKIVLLNDEVSSAISAGEVVERPLSVVKELIENSIDAKAKRIEIGIEEGGKKLIYVKDDGIGMDKDDLEKCLLKHATSKISNIDDLYNIKTLGFRGEALYSISAVSELTIITKTKDNHHGHELFSRYGSKPEIRETGASDGTFIIVKNLFNNIPARKKFLKSTSWEKSLILEYLEGIAIMYPDLELVFTDNNRINLLLKSTSSVEERIFQIFPDLFGKINHLTIDQGSYSGTIYISQPDLPLPPFQIFSVNKRFVKDRLFYKALQDFYGNQRKKSPFVAIFLDIPPQDVDVNVHPTKKEIKFRNPTEVYNLLRNLLESANKKEIFYISETERESYIKTSENITNYNIQESQQIFSDGVYKTNVKEDYNYKIIGTFCNGYLLVEKNDTLYIIDQHAAHERLIYNKIQENYKKADLKSQKIIPYIINITESKKQFYESNKLILEKFGYKFEDSGPMSIAITAIPSALSLDTAIEIFTEIVEDKSILKREEDFLQNLSSISACKEAVKKTTRLNVEEIEYLLNTLTEKNIETYCPHGRNFIITITLNELEKKFGRKS